MYGETGDGKTALAGELAEYVRSTEGKNARLYTADRGGIDTIRPYIDLGIVEVVSMDATDPWVFLNCAVRGMTRGADGKWVAGNNSNIGLFIFESLTSFADALMQSLAQKASAGVNIGGGANVNFTASGDGLNVKVGGNNQAHYGVVQNRIVEEVWESQKLPGWLMWTASLKRDDDQNAAGKVLGPAVVGKALTGEVPRWFQYCFRVAAIPGIGAAAERHLLYLGDHADTQAGNAKGLGNTRMPLDAPKPEKMVIEPASIVKAIQLIDASYQPAVDAIRRRLKL